MSETLRGHPQIRVRMGAHSEPVNKIEDVNGQHNVAGAGINTARPVLDCGDAGSIFFSRKGSLMISSNMGTSALTWLTWGSVPVKHGVKLRLVNFVSGRAGNSECPEKLKNDAFSPVTEADQRLRRSRSRRLLISALTVAALVLCISAIIWIRWHDRHEISYSVAVMQFLILSDERRDAYFDDGMQNDIFRDLVKIADLKVISRPSVKKYRDIATLNLKEIANELHVRYILESSVQRANDRIRVQVQMIDDDNDAHV